MVCVAATVHCAVDYAKRDARLFTCLTFFALCWAVLLPYYALIHLMNTLDHKSLAYNNLREIIELFPAYSGFLLTLASAPLRREADYRHKHHSDAGIRKYDTWVLRALYLTVVPHAIVIGFLGITYDPAVYTLRCLGLVFTCLGFFSILHALKELKGNKSRLWRMLLVVVVFYIGYEVVYSLLLMFEVLKSGMRPSDRMVFAGLKMAFTATFLYAIITETAEYRRHKTKNAIP